MSESKVRVRFAPSPTGYLHVGGLRSALYNYLFAKNLNGKLILRIEDTDQTRLVEGAKESLLNSLKWGGIDYDEGPDKDGGFGPYTQSERTELYRKYVAILEDKGFAYKCFCTKDDLEKIREEQMALTGQIGYDRRCRKLSENEVQKRIDNGKKYTIRLKVPLTDELVEYEDLVFGKISVVSKTIDDQVLMKNDGFPTYHLANVVDDHLMNISHVIRGEEWNPSTPKHIVLYNAFGWTPPKFAHLPLLVNSEKKKLSKRHGDVSVSSFKDKGILKETLINFVSLLGWHSSDDREFFTIEELIKEFSFARVSKSPAVFDYVKLNWMNSQYIKDLETSKLAELYKPFFEEANIDISDNNKYLKIVEVSKGRVEVLNQVVGVTEDFFFEDKIIIEDEKAKELINEESTKLIFAEFIKNIDSADNFDGATVKSFINNLGKENKVKGKFLWMPFRIALTGKMKGFDLDQLIDIFGKEKTLRRIKESL